MKPSEYIDRHIRPADVSRCLDKIRADKRKKPGTYNSSRDKRLLVKKMEEGEAVLQMRGLETEIVYPESRYLKCSKCGNYEHEALEEIGCQAGCSAPWEQDQSANLIFFKKIITESYAPTTDK